VTEPLIVPTHFTTTSELADGLAERVDEGRLMLYGPAAYPDGDWVQFTVLLADQSVGLNGVGRSTASIDGGADRPEGARWDIVLDALSFDEASEPVYEAMLAARRPPFGEGDGDVDVDVGDAAPGEDTVDENVYEVDDRTTGAEMVVDEADGLVESIQPSVPPVPESPGSLPPPPAGGVLTRPTLPAVWRPVASPAPAPRAPSGAFAHPQGSLPVPPNAPRPELSPDQRIAPAPRPPEATPADVELV